MCGGSLCVCVCVCVYARVHARKCVRAAVRKQMEHLLLSKIERGFLSGSVVKNSPAKQETQVNPSVGKTPGEGNGNPLQYSCLGNPWTEEPGGHDLAPKQQDEKN